MKKASPLNYSVAVLFASVGALAASVAALQTVQTTAQIIQKQARERVETKSSGYTGDLVPAVMRAEIFVPANVGNDDIAVTIIRHKMNDQFQAVVAKTLSTELNTDEARTKFVLEACAGLNDMQDHGYVVTSCSAGLTIPAQKL